jgi:hypothetical protein
MTQLRTHGIVPILLARRSGSFQQFSRFAMGRAAVGVGLCLLVRGQPHATDERSFTGADESHLCSLSEAAVTRIAAHLSFAPASGEGVITQLIDAHFSALFLRSRPGHRDLYPAGACPDDGPGAECRCAVNLTP